LAYFAQKCVDRCSHFDSGPFSAYVFWGLVAIAKEEEGKNAQKRVPSCRNISRHEAIMKRTRKKNVSSILRAFAFFMTAQSTRLSTNKAGENQNKTRIKTNGNKKLFPSKKYDNSPLSKIKTGSCNDVK
jgi:hypothetical protein